MANTWGGGTPTLDAVLTSGASAAGLGINDLIDPSQAQDAATKNYVDGAIPAAQNLEDTLTAGDFTNNKTIYGGAGSAGGKILLGSAGAVTITAVGANKNVTLVATGTWAASAGGSSVAHLDSAESYFGYHADTEIGLQPNLQAFIGSGTASIVITKDSDVQINPSATGGVLVLGSYIFTSGAGAPGASFISLIYRDTTAVTGGAYAWNFATGAYVAISGAF